MCIIYLHKIRIVVPQVSSYTRVIRLAPRIFKDNMYEFGGAPNGTGKKSLGSRS